MYCMHPVGDSKHTSGEFPLLSFMHGDFGGGIVLSTIYDSFLKYVASSGFVICAPLACMVSCRDEQHLHHLRAITAAIDLGAEGVLPIRESGAVGVIGHSTGGMTTLRCSYRENVAAYGIGAAMALNGDGAALIADDDIRFRDIDPALPMFLVAGDKDIVEPKNATESNHDLILAANPGQPLLAAKLRGQGHYDANDITFLHPAPQLASPFIVAFFSHALAPRDACTSGYAATLGDQLRAAAPDYYDNRLWNQTF